MRKKTEEQISFNMKQIKNENSEIEILLCKELWNRGIRYRKNVKSIVGKPDIVFIGKKLAVFCDGEFWHGYDWENENIKIKSHREFWIPKIEGNMKRDEQVNAALEAEGWTVLRFWGKEIKKNVEACADEIIKVLKEK